MNVHFSHRSRPELTKVTVVDALVEALKDYEGYRQHLNAYLDPVDEPIAA